MKIRISDKCNFTLTRLMALSEMLAIPLKRSYMRYIGLMYNGVVSFVVDWKAGPAKCVPRASDGVGNR